MLDNVVTYETHHHNISDLEPCTNYTIDVFAVAPDTTQSEKVRLYTATADSG